MKETNKPSTAPNVHNGTYAVTHPERGHWTVKCHTVQSGPLAGKRILSMFVGLDNQTDFAGVAFWDDEKNQAVMWDRHRSTACKYGMVDGYNWGSLWNETEKNLAVWADLVTRGDRGFWKSEGCEVSLTARCARCNELLVGGESINVGICAECVGRVS